MEMHQVRYFLAAASEKNFTKAAVKCSVSPPSLLRAIKLLEHEFGGPLFNRERARMHLTELGRIALPHLESIAKETFDVKNKARDFVNLSAATLKLGVMCTVAPVHFIALIEGFRRRFPSVGLQLIDGTADSLQSLLLAGDLEVAIYALPGEPPHERIHMLPLFREQMVIALHPKHPLAKKKAIEAASLHGEAYLDRTLCEFGSYAQKQFAERSIIDRTVYQSDRDDWILAMAAAGMGYGFMPRSNAQHPGVVTRPLVEPEYWRTVNLATTRGRPHSPAVGAIVREVMRANWQGKKALSVQAMQGSEGPQ